MYQAEVLDSSGNTEFVLDLNTAEKVAGALAAGIAIAADIEYEYGKQFQFATNLDLHKFRLLNNVDDVILYTDKIKPGWYGLWMRGTQRFKNSLYTFETEDFLEGVVWICEKFGLDYRNYVNNLPFDNLGKKYSILGNPYPLVEEAEDAPDLDDIDEEEAGDEEIQMLFRKDDLSAFTG